MEEKKGIGLIQAARAIMAYKKAMKIMCTKCKHDIITIVMHNTKNKQIDEQGILTSKEKIMQILCNECKGKLVQAFKK